MHWRAGDDPQASGPVVPVPAALWRAPAGRRRRRGTMSISTAARISGPDISLPQTLVQDPFPVRAVGGTLAILAFDSVKTVG